MYLKSLTNRFIPKIAYITTALKSVDKLSPSIKLHMDGLSVSMKTGGAISLQDFDSEECQWLIEALKGIN